VSGSGISWNICKSAPGSRQTRQHLTPQFFAGRMPFLPPNQQRQSTEGSNLAPDGNQCIRIMEKMLEFSSAALFTLSLYGI